MSSSTAGDVKKPKTTYKETRDGLNQAVKVIEKISDASSLLAPLKATCGVISIFLDTARAIDENAEGWNDLKELLDSQVALLGSKREDLNNSQTEEQEVFIQMLDLYIENLQGLRDGIEETINKKKHGVKAFFRNITAVRIEADKIKACKERITEYSGNFTTSVLWYLPQLSISLAEKQAALARSEANSIALLTLSSTTADGRQYESCLSGTRGEIISAINDWKNDETESKRIFWLCDVPGSGKSTVAHTMTAKWEAEGCIVPRFFFSKTSTDTSDTRLFCSTLAKDLASRYPELQSPIAEALKKDASLLSRSFSEQFENLISEPLRQVTVDLVFVIDAADECSIDSRKIFLETLLRHLPLIPRLKIFITSRPESDIMTMLRPDSIVYSMEFRMQGILIESNAHDVATYMNHYLRRWLTSEQLGMLVKQANGSFIWASTARRQLELKLKKRVSKEDFDNTLKALIGQGTGNDLNGLYSSILEDIFQYDYHSVDFTCHLLAILASLYEPVSIITLEQLVTQRADSMPIDHLLQGLTSVLDVQERDDPVKFLHPTFLEYLLQLRDEGYSINTTNANLELTCNGISLMLQELKEDILGVSDPQKPPPQNKTIPGLATMLVTPVSRGVLYSTKSWMYHACQTIENERCVESVVKLLSTKLLNWVELVGLTGQIATCLDELRRLRESIAASSNRSQMTLVGEWCREAFKFMQYQQRTIEKSSLETYNSCLAFLHRDTLLYQTYSPEYRSRIPRILSGIAKDWPNHQILLGHTNRVQCVAFSPSGRRIVSSSDEFSLRLWDGVTGASIGQPLEGHRRVVTCLAFSPDSRRIVSGSNDNTLRLWDGVTGASIGNPLKGHKGPVRCLAFSSDGNRIASGSSDNTLRLWDGVAGECIAQPLEGHTGPVSNLAFSPDGTRIASVSDDHGLRLWNGVTGEIVAQSSEVHLKLITCLAFSPDGSRIVTGSEDSSLLMWDGMTAKSIGAPLKGHREPVKCVAFSPDGHRIVSGSSDNTLRLWDGMTGRRLDGWFKKHDHVVSCVAFSPDGKRIVSGSFDKTLRLWNGMTGASMGQPLKGHTDSVTCLAFSLDGRLIVSGSSDNTLRLWHEVTGGSSGQSLEGHELSVKCFAFSPDGKRVVSGSYDKTLRLWDGVAGGSIGASLKGHTGPVTCVAYSPDGSRFVSGSSDSTLRFWHGVSGEPLRKPLKGHSRLVTCIAFSPDGTRIVSGSQDSTLRLWDGMTGESIGIPLEGHEYPVTCCAFSPDGERIASGSRDRTLRLWDGTTGTGIAGPLKGHTSLIKSLAFSPDGQRLVSADDYTLRIWDGVTGGIFDWTTSFSSENLRFYDDGCYVRCGDRTWRISGTNLVPTFNSDAPIQDIVHYTREDHIISFINHPRYRFILPGDFAVELWVAAKGSIALGGSDGRVMILNCDHLIDTNL